jgi:hypothetical protein
MGNPAESVLGLQKRCVVLSLSRGGEEDPRMHTPAYRDSVIFSIVP